MRLKYSLSVLFLSFICFYSFLFAQETLTITTYYPSPYGSYRELRSQRMAIGDTYNNISTVCWGATCGGATVIPDAADLVVEGFVGIGTPVPTSILHLSSGAATTDLTLTNTIVPVEGVFKVGLSGGINRMVLGTFTAHDLAFWAGNTTRMTIVGAGANAGNVGIGTASPNARLEVNGGDIYIWRNGGNPRLLVGDSDVAGNFGGLRWDSVNDIVQIGTDTGGYVLNLGESGSVGIGGAPRAADQLAVYGRVSTNFPGGGTKQMFSFDLAEDISSRGDVEASDVVIIDARNNQCVVKSKKPYDSAVAGIVSLSPAFHIAMPDGKTPLALAGRVLCKVTTENGPINRGDLLVTSSKPGYAMKGDPGKIQIGTVLGKAMEPLEKGEGKITVLVTLQ